MQKWAWPRCGPYISYNKAPFVTVLGRHHSFNVSKYAVKMSFSDIKSDSGNYCQYHKTTV